MKRLLFFLPALLSITGLCAQFQDNFSDGDLTNNPTWLGNVGKFAVTDGELQLLDLIPSANNTTFLYVPVATSREASTTWTFLVRLNFSPSTTNLARVYLASSQPPGAANFNGYYLQIGGISGSNDALELFRQDGTSRSSLLSGATGAVGGATALARVRVTRSTAGEWTLEADYSGGQNWQFEAAATDTTYNVLPYFGLACIYTSTRGEAFFFDDFFIDPLYVDLAPPQSISASALGATQVRLTANEPLDPIVAANPALYSLSNGAAITTATPEAGDPATVLLNLAEPLVNLQDYTLTATGLVDANGNIAGPLSTNFRYLLVSEPGPFDILVTEIMADPSPPVGLPNAEYVELYNHSNQVFQLQGMGLSNGSTPQALPAHLLLPGEYVIVTDDDAAADFAPFGTVLGLASFPALTNSGDDVRLTSATGATLFEVSYASSWYADPNRADGGYSLELIDLEGPYTCAGNWAASPAASGGSPAAPNTALATDARGPALETAFPDQTDEIVLQFDETLDATSAEVLALYSISPDLGILEAMLESGGSAVRLSLAQPLLPGQAYTLTIAPLSDCLGNTSAAFTQQIGLPEAAQPGDLVINEVLFNPRTGGSDFVELYNRSAKIIDLRGLRVANLLLTTSSNREEVTANYLLFPDTYVVITENPDNILANYNVPQPTALLQNELPTLADDAGNVSILLPDATVIDAFDYRQDMHSALLSDKEGVSLERLNPDAPTQNNGNWFSAASTVGFATPTGQNSQYRSTTNPDPTSDNILRVPASTFSPDGDGFEDVLLIEYQTPGPGYVASLRIFDAQGRMVRQLTRQELLDGAGSIPWDGSTDEGSRGRIGIYFIQAEVFNPNGDTRREQHECVLAGQLR